MAHVLRRYWDIPLIAGMGLIVLVTLVDALKPVPLLTVSFRDLPSIPIPAPRLPGLLTESPREMPHVGEPIGGEPIGAEAIDAALALTATTGNHPQSPRHRKKRGQRRHKKATGPVAVNRASMVELQRLPGIGPALARRLVQYRQQHGAFSTPESLLAVSGIGPKKLAAIRPFLRF